MIQKTLVFTAIRVKLISNMNNSS